MYAGNTTVSRLRTADSVSSPRMACKAREPHEKPAPHRVLLLQRLLLVPTLTLAHDPELVSVQVAVAPRRVSVIRFWPC